MSKAAVGKFQSTLPRGERPIEDVQLYKSVLISIHAPARGATSAYIPSPLTVVISIHAPARGATKAQQRFRECTGYFNPRSREGSDKNVFDSGVTDSVISIHAPARGATAVCFIWQIVDTNFNPRSREGSDKDGASVKLMDRIFQSTLPRGERQKYLAFSSASFAISIHAPARGATYLKYRYNIGSFVFQSTLPRGERRT